MNEFNKYLKNISGWNSHLPLLFNSLELTKTEDVVELGCGEGSTLFLHEYCLKNNRQLYSLDSNEDWVKKFKHLESPMHIIQHVPDWDKFDFARLKIAVALVDHAPGERRIIDIERLANLAKILVLHDTEPVGAGDYKFQKIWHLFKYRKDDSMFLAWTTAVSNFIEL